MSQNSHLAVVASFALVVTAAAGQSRPTQSPTAQSRPAQSPTVQSPTAQSQRTAVRLTFGVYTSERATEMFKSFAPVIEDLEARTAAHYGKPVEIKLEIYKTYEECFDSFLAGKVDFVRFGPAAYCLATERSRDLRLLAVEEDEGKKLAVGVIVVRNDSPIRSLADLAGKTFAFGDEMSTIGRYLAQRELVRAGVRADDLKGFKYLGRHDRVAKAVEVGDFDAGSVHSSTFEKMNTDGALRVLASMTTLSKAWVARAGLEPKLGCALRKAILELRHPATLAVLKVTGFQPAADKEFQEVREGIEAAKQFEQPDPAPPDGKR